jgi:hypothetical protein
MKGIVRKPLVKRKKTPVYYDKGKRLGYHLKNFFELFCLFSFRAFHIPEFKEFDLFDTDIMKNGFSY